MDKTEKFVRKIGHIYEKVMNLRDNDDFVVNQEQMDKFVEVLNFFYDTANNLNGELEPIRLEPKEENGGVTATFLLFDIYGENIQRFSKIIGYTSGITIESTVDGVCISVTVPGVFIPKK